MMFFPMPQGSKKVNTNDAEVGKLANDTSEQADRLKTLENKFTRLSTLTEALWDILLEKGELDEHLLKARIQQVAQEREDRKTEKLPCRKCGMQNAASKPACIYCGGELDGELNESPFAGL
ncbi:hypothetical protein SAMN02745866_01431 [Alteromonadaceae bacterium Bs31]|nr:hypothetical protein SAMN02745866_01431 [Alteromonadaceae bacterium Bs31]